MSIASRADEFFDFVASAQTRPQVNPNDVVTDEAKDALPGGHDLDAYTQAMQKYYENMINDPAQNMDKWIAGGTGQTNANMLGRGDTLRYSRLADALNNQYFRSPRRASTQIRTIGGGVSGQASDLGSPFRMPIETEEMRQQATARAGDAATKQADIARQAAALGMTVEQYRNVMGLETEYRRDTKRAQIDRAQMAFRELRMTADKINVLNSLMNQGNTPTADMLAYLYGMPMGVPDPQQRAFLLALGDKVKDDIDNNVSSEQMYNNLTRFITEATMKNAALLTGAFGRGLQSFIPDVQREANRASS